MFEYDRVKMKNQGEGFVCVENTPVSETLPEAEEEALAVDGFFFRKLKKNEVHILVNRLDVQNLTKAVEVFQETYA